MNLGTDWIDKGVIASDRSLEVGESLVVALCDAESSAVLETVRFVPSSGEVGQLQWPKAFADHINLHSNGLRAGIKNADGSFSTQASADANRLWSGAGTDRYIVTTACRMGEWRDLQIINAVGSLPLGTTVTCTLSHADTLVQTVESRPEPGQSGRYTWPAFLSHAINRSGGLMRAGEKDEGEKRFVVLGSSYRNHIWCPMGAGAAGVELTFKLSADALQDAQHVY